jgi:hypothetical protein
VTSTWSGAPRRVQRGPARRLLRAAPPGPDSHQLQPRALERLEQVIVAAAERGLAVVVANLRDPQLMADPPSHRERLLAGTRSRG